MNRKTISLELLEVERPCPADWDAMRGSGASRFCEHCQKHVHDFSLMTRSDAERLVCEQAGSLCVRMARDANGVVKTLDYAPRRKIRGWRFWTGVGLIGAAFAAVGNVMYHKQPTAAATPVIVEMGEMMMGDIIAPTVAEESPTNNG